MMRLWTSTLVLSICLLGGCKSGGDQPQAQHACPCARPQGAAADAGCACGACAKGEPCTCPAPAPAPAGN